MCQSEQQFEVIQDLAITSGDYADHDKDSSSTSSEEEYYYDVDPNFDGYPQSQPGMNARGVHCTPDGWIHVYKKKTKRAKMLGIRLFDNIDKSWTIKWLQ